MIAALPRSALLAAALLLLFSLFGMHRTAAEIAAHPAFEMQDCLRGQELALHRDFVEGRHTPAALFLANDESVYVRAARQIAGGEVATDYLGDFFQAVRQNPLDEALQAHSPTYRLSRAMAALDPPQRPSFVGYRSMVFAALGVPIVQHTGCTAEGLHQLRLSMLPWRAAGIVLAGLLAFLLAPRGKALAMVLAGTGMAFDAQLDNAGATFMPDMPGATLLLAVLAALAALAALSPTPAGLAAPASVAASAGPSAAARRRRALWAGLGLGLGLLSGLAALVKADLIYVLPLALLAVPLAVATERRRALLLAVLLAASVHALVLGAWAARNHALTGEWFVTSKDSINLYVGNTPESQQRHYRFAMSPQEWSAVEQVVQARPAELKSKGPEVALRHHLRDLAWTQVKAHPGRILSMFLDRLLLYVQGDSVHHFPSLGRAGLALQLLVMVAAIGGVLLSARASLRAMRPTAAAFALSLAIVSLVCYELRYLSHVFALAVVIASVLLGTAAAALAARWRASGDGGQGHRHGHGHGEGRGGSQGGRQQA